MKAIKLDHPVRVYFKDGECYHDSATILIANGFPSFVRGKGPDVIYPWENVKHVLRVADEVDTAVTAAEVERLQQLHHDTLAKMRCALSEAIGHGSSANADFDGLINATELLRQQWWSTRTRAIDLAKAQEEDQRSIASLTEQRNVLKRQIEELRADIRKPAAPEPKQVEPGGPIWVRVVDTTSKHFGLVGRLEGIEFDSIRGDEMWSVDLGGIANVYWQANLFAVVGAGRQEHSSTPPDNAEHQQAQNRDQWRATCLAYGAKDCTVYFGPGDEVTFVVEMAKGHHVNDLTRALWLDHRLTANKDYNMREVRPIVDGVKPSTSKHTTDNGQP